MFFPGPADAESQCQRGASIIAWSLTYSSSLCSASLTSFLSAFPFQATAQG